MQIKMTRKESKFQVTAKVQGGLIKDAATSHWQIQCFFNWIIAIPGGCWSWPGLHEWLSSNKQQLQPSQQWGCKHCNQECPLQVLEDLSDRASNYLCSIVQEGIVLIPLQAPWSCMHSCCYKPIAVLPYLQGVSHVNVWHNFRSLRILLFTQSLSAQALSKWVPVPSIFWHQPETCIIAGLGIQQSMALLSRRWNSSRVVPERLYSEAWPEQWSFWCVASALLKSLEQVTAKSDSLLLVVWALLWHFKRTRSSFDSTSFCGCLKLSRPASKLSQQSLCCSFQISIPLLSNPLQHAWARMRCPSHSACGLCRYLGYNWPGPGSWEG